MAVLNGRLARGFKRIQGILAMNVGRIAATSPLSQNWGFDRGKAIDRHYIGSFLAAHSADIAGTTLEVAEDLYSTRFGGEQVEQVEILSLEADNPEATIVGDLADPATLPAGRFDCIICTQTLHLIYDMRAAVANIRQALRPGGVALITVPGITPVDRGKWKDKWYWSLTEAALVRLLSGSFEEGKVSMSTYGNLHGATAFLHGAAVQDVAKRKLDQADRRYPVTVAARAVA